MKNNTSFLLVAATVLAGFFASVSSIVEISPSASDTPAAVAQVQDGATPVAQPSAGVE